VYWNFQSNVQLFPNQTGISVQLGNNCTCKSKLDLGCCGIKYNVIAYPNLNSIQVQLSYNYSLIGLEIPVQLGNNCTRNHVSMDHKLGQINMCISSCMVIVIVHSGIIIILLLLELSQCGNHATVPTLINIVLYSCRLAMYVDISLIPQAPPVFFKCKI
jgi:hypothetical protein